MMSNHAQSMHLFISRELLVWIRTMAKIATMYATVQLAMIPVKCAATPLPMIPPV
jgi:hypothetical protein